MRPYRPVDLGYVVPMAGGRSCGRILGSGSFGRLPTFLHYFMSVVRSDGPANRAGVLSDLLADRDGRRAGGRRGKR